MNNFHRIIWYHKCVCGILLRKLKKYSKYTMKTCQENLWHIYVMCYFNLVIGWRMQGWLKGQSHILKTAIMVPRKRLSRAIAATFWPRDGRCPPSPSGPECKKWHKEKNNFVCWFFLLFHIYPNASQYGNTLFLVALFPFFKNALFST